jgi:uncharacterized membrane protein SpoIIM required for sporulation
VDVDAFVGAHRASWDRLAELVRRSGSMRSGSLSGAEVDELVTLYQRTSTHLSMLRSSAPDPVLVARLSALVTRARAAVTGSHNPAWREVALFFTHRFPAGVYRSWRWWVPVSVAFVLVSAGIAAWVAGSDEVRSSIAAPEAIAELTRPGGEFESYYSTGPAASFAAGVWTNNAWVAAGALMLGVLLGLPVIAILWVNAANVGVSAGLMADAGRLDVFLGLIAPHGLLELTAVFVAAGAGLRLGWTVVDPGPRRRADALAETGRAAVGIALGLACVLLVTGVIEAFVTPSGLPTAARVGIGVAAELAFLWYVFGPGRRAALAGDTGDLDPTLAAAGAPTAA